MIKAIQLEQLFYFKNDNFNDTHIVGCYLYNPDRITA